MDNVKVTTRIPSYLKQALDKEAEERHMTQQQLFILKLSLPMSQPEYTPALSDQVALILERVSRLQLDMEQLREPANAIQAEPETVETGGLALCRDDFMAKYGLDDKSYGLANLSGRNGYWISHNGEKWAVSGRGKKAIWQMLAG